MKLMEFQTNHKKLWPNQENIDLIANNREETSIRQQSLWNSKQRQENVDLIKKTRE